MANGADSENFRNCLEIRPGMKREFAMMINQSQFISPIGRIRSSRSTGGGYIENSMNKKNKSSKNGENKEKLLMAEEKFELDAEKPPRVEEMCEEEEPKSGIVDSMSDDDKKNNLEEDSKVFKDFKGELGKCKTDNGVEVDGYINIDVKLSCKEGESDSGEVILKNTYSLRRVTRSISKPANKEVKEEVAESDVVNMRSMAVVTSRKAVIKLEDKMLEKTIVKKRPTKLKELLETGLFEGLGVRYLRRSKVRGPSDSVLRGIIKGEGILCFCDVCSGARIVTPNQFELHAGSANKRPSEYIYLENGRTLRDVLTACKDVPLEVVTATIQDAIGFSSMEKSVVCQNCKVVLPDSGYCRRTLLCVMCMDMMALKESQPNLLQQSDTGHRPLLSVSSEKSSDGWRDDNLSSTKGKGKLTQKDLRMHKKGFEELVDGAEVGYFDDGKEMLKGYKKGSGIFCLCCNTEVSPSQFEAHAGFSSRRKPYHHIYISNGYSLHDWAVMKSQIRGISADENDDLCSICTDGGDLLLCDTCPRAFHPECISLQGVPEGKFYCRYCMNIFEKGKRMEHNANAVAAGRVAGVDPIEQITMRCIRIFGTPAEDIGGCVLCSGHKFSETGFDDGTVIICDQCDKEFHVGCLKEHKIDDLKELPTGKWFCCTECSSIHSALENLVAVGQEKLSDSLMNVIKKKHKEKGSQDCGDLDIKWRLLCGKMASDETRVLLSSAVAIFHEQFDPIADSDTGHLDFIPHMVYGRKTEDQDFGGMYCAILTVNSCPVSAGLFRIFGREVAELPLVATGSNYQGLGYFQSLFSCIETLLESLDVKNLLLPAADEAKSIWTKKFGFGKITQDQLNTYRKDYQMMVFQGTSMLQKTVCQA